MLKKFLLNALSSFVGAWLAIVIFIVGITVLILGIVGSVAMGDRQGVGKHSILKISLAGAIEEIESTSQFDYTILLNGKIETPQSLRTILAALEKGATDSQIDALYIECGGVSAAPATLNALRNAIKQFKKSGKRVFAYGDVMTMGDYYVATIADVVYLNPAGSLDLQGISGTSLYYKDFLDKIGIEIQTVRVGTFKSAVEPYISNSMSEPARLQLDTLYGGMWNYILEGLAESRDVRASTIDSLVNKFLFLDEASAAKKYKLVDDCLYFREVKHIMANYVGKDEDDLNFVSSETLLGPVSYNPSDKNQIAVVYAVGEIAEYEGAGINCDNLVPIIVSLAQNEDVKGMVLRVNSPGGSVFGSEQIGEALDYFQSKGKPLAVSMGDYAASGGYWISAGADRIFADPLTITGSIGIFGMVPNVSGLVGKLGIHPQTVSTNPGIQFPSIFYPMSEQQHAALQKNVERGYKKFVTRVAEGRNKSESYIESIAEGRVWSAIKAQELGLVDQLGNLQDAIKWVETKAKVSNPNVVTYPAPETTIWSILAESGIYSNPEVQMVMERLQTESIDRTLLNFSRWFLLQSHEQARCPYYKISM